MTSKPILVFDVNETLLDLHSLLPHFTRIFGDEGAMRAWFAQLVLYSGALTLAGDYVPFGELGGAVLKMLGETRGRSVTDDDVKAVRDGVAAMPPHPDVPASLARLKQAGFRLFTLTNNPLATCKQQLDRAGLAQLFEGMFSVDDAVRRYKPAPEVYHAVERSLNAAPAELCLIACHAWDTLGAAALGWKSALILREGNAPVALGVQPDIIGRDLSEVADALIGQAA